jgi:hypothetical protein
VAFVCVCKGETNIFFHAFFQHAEICSYFKWELVVASVGSFLHKIFFENIILSISIEFFEFFGCGYCEKEIKNEKILMNKKFI